VARIKKKSLDQSQTLTANIFSRILYKTTFSNKKGNPFVLSIDLLKEDVKKDLLAITALRLEQTYTRLLEELNSTSLMQKRGNSIFLQCIKDSCEDFLTKQYGYKIEIDLQTLKQSLYTKTILNDAEILFKVPFYTLIDPKVSIFRLIYYPIYNYASESFIEALLDNLIIEISNCVVYFSLLNLSSVYAFRQTIYRAKFLSLRNFERFRNNLNWQLRIRYYIQRPIDLYNNRYNLYVLRTSGLYCRTIYANRSKEVSTLKNLPLLTISIIEIRDFATSRLDEAFYLISKGVRFTLTSILGQTIGLVWRGVIEGLKK